MKDTPPMKQRLDYAAAAPQVMKGMYELEKQVKASGLEKSLIELVKMRASQINGCAFCLHMHSRDARANGETEERLYLLDAWQESSLYTERERAALNWTESLTLVSNTHAPDADYEAMAAQFAPDEQVKLTLLICAINAWNRIAIGFRSQHPVAAPAAARAGAPAS
jgi:AhpD family alkylhydroperoxidase